MADLHAAESATKGAVESGTNSKQTLAWTRFQQYIKHNKILEDPFLDKFDRYQQIKIISAFAHAIREGRFNNRRNSTLKSESCQATIDCMAQTFCLANRPDPRLDEDGKPSLFLHRQLRGCKKSDKPEKQQVALTGSIIKELHKMAFTQLDKAMCLLFKGSFFFAMRSCKYLIVSGKNWTKFLTLQNIRFFSGRRELNHSNKNLHTVETVSITFEFQK
jgi:hypothetical protein